MNPRQLSSAATPSTSGGDEVDPADFDKLVQDIVDNPEILRERELTDAELLEVQKRLNPYHGRACAPLATGSRKTAAVSYTNLRESYLRRFTMTSLAGFVFQVGQEWEPPAEVRQWAPPSTEKPTPFVAADLADRLEAAAAIAREAEAAAVEAGRLTREAAEATLLAETPEAKAEAQAAEKAARSESGRAAALLYTATHAAHLVGGDATARLRATADSASAFPEIRAALKQFPVPPPAGAIEMPVDAARGLVNAFLQEWFRFDPSVHVRAGHDADTIAAARGTDPATGAEVDTADPGHVLPEALLAPRPKPLPEHAEAVNTILSTTVRRNAALAIIRDDELADAVLAALGAPDNFVQYLHPLGPDSEAAPAVENVPPQDTFHRWEYYTEVNYEALRVVTEALYPERPDLEMAVALWETFEGTDAEVDAAFERHCQRYQDETPSSITSLNFGQWSLLASFKQNRERVNFYNKNTEVLKRILDRHTEDKKVGAELMRNRVRQTKAKNIATEGPDAAGLSQYRASLGKDLGGQGVERVISPEEMKRLNKARGDIKAARELELLEQLEDTIARLGDKANLTDEEASELKLARERLPLAREMANVPDDAIQVDVFSAGADGTFGKTHIYTRSEEALFPEGATIPPEQPLAPYALEHVAANLEGK